MGLLFSGCTEVKESECLEKGYTHTIQNALLYKIGCSKMIDNNMIETYNILTGELYIEHTEKAGRQYVIKKDVI